MAPHDGPVGPRAVPASNRPLGVSWPHMTVQSGHVPYRPPTDPRGQLAPCRLCLFFRFIFLSFHLSCSLSLSIRVSVYFSLQSLIAESPLIFRFFSLFFALSPLSLSIFFSPLLCPFNMAASAGIVSGAISLPKFASKKRSYDLKRCSPDRCSSSSSHFLGNKFFVWRTKSISVRPFAPSRRRSPVMEWQDCRYRSPSLDNHLLLPFGPFFSFSTSCLSFFEKNVAFCLRYILKLAPIILEYIEKDVKLNEIIPLSVLVLDL